MRIPELGAPIRPGAKGGVSKRLAAFNRHAPLRGHRLLDVGCGNGAYTTVMAEGFDEVVAIDVVDEHLDALRAAIAGTHLESKIEVRKMSADKLEFPDGHFDVVTGIEVLEHIERLDEALDEISRVLAVGGAFCVTVPNRLFPIETHSFMVPGTRAQRPGKLVPFLPYLPPLHRRLATARNFLPHELRDRMLKAGFDEVGLDYIMPPFDNWKFGARFLRPLTNALERSPLRIFGVSIVGIYRKAHLAAKSA